ncbi:MAG: PepSY-associated TM helix domain-containing protein [Labilithrix sp.]|nr:PepSY-associated TM helix domain-containing protein [Labilithrix sp.]
MTDVSKNALPDPRRGKRAPWRPWLRAIHRDVGYVAVGLTFIYALSGLAVNHITDWSDGDASFKSYQATHELGALTGEDQAIADAIRRRLSIDETPREIYRPSPEELEILFDKRTLHVNTATGRVIDEGQKPRFLLRVANWLHLNRGKKAWTYVADAYAAGLLLLAASGMFMIAGKKGLLGRGAVLVGVGIAIPVLYVMFAGP